MSRGCSRTPAASRRTATSARSGTRAAALTSPTLSIAEVLPDLELPDHAGRPRRLSELVGGDPTVVQFFRGWWCPKEQAFFRRLVALQEEAEVAYPGVVSISVGPPHVPAAF